MNRFFTKTFARFFFGFVIILILALAILILASYATKGQSQVTPVDNTATPQ